MNWQTELNNSLNWILTALFWVILCFSVTMLALKKTTFGKKFWCIVSPSINKKTSIKLIIMLLILFIMILLEVRFSVLNSFFYNGLYSSMQELNIEKFWFFAKLNALLVTAQVIHTIADYFFQQVFEIRWLESLNTTLIKRWLNKKKYYRLKYKRDLPDNIDQRIEQDAREFITSTVQIVRGIINSVLTTIEFTIILWSLSGILTLFGFNIEKGVVFFIYAFIIFATFMSVWIGRPLIKLNFTKEKLNGDYRYSLIRVRDNAESIAFYNGEPKEQTFLQHQFRQIIHNRWSIVLKMLGLNSFNSGVTRVAKLLPLMLQAPRFFSGQIKLGDMHQTVQAFNRLMTALSFFRLFYEQFTLYQARLNRLYGFITKMDELDKQNFYHPFHCSRKVALKNFGIKDEQGNILLNNLNINLENGDALLIQGASGTGKTSLLKAIAGIYPFETIGIAEHPCMGSLFLPQRPYMPQGTLREAICYPNINPSHAELEQTMKDCALGKYIQALNVKNDWQAILSPGELQRVAFIRILLTKPDVVFLDETTSALDETTEHLLYQTIKARLPEMIILSVGHRSTLQQFHNKQLKLDVCLLCEN
ncbi:ABC transporter ATP-binding protein/permease [Haemophilus influenzae]|uniref:Vitamin B12 transport ATP-binding protein BacA n=3 Tax=Haemophilus influenzae TaxID=727 RepID=A0A2S9S1W6_HAEIF|nr:ABC transporter ATP-binding protein/permease [Haemophilus influenzae]EEW77537.1 ABC transporter ATP-binding protein [Haemophilus influenzae NT127]MCK8795491.1 ABC transporter ATP-binding protein/permease [Haemophilus influenzae]MCK8814718.1 ABC transporter ATP-binding protein/permease [Haemophilus influenzae]MCK8830484.1 ABC transporter ATP-binding protein/permease [Haemophilus influenzae]MCK8841293.1 ABC transporter ATP-binding protein/permease [Haemophilus influenzae]